MNTARLDVSDPAVAEVRAAFITPPPPSAALGAHASTRSKQVVPLRTVRRPTRLSQAIAAVRSDTAPETFCVLTYEGKSKIVLKERGTGNCYKAVDDMDDAAVSYALLRIT